MRFLRTTSTQRLLATLAGIVIAVAGGTAIAVAASSGGPVPRPQKLADAVHSALGTPTVPGISARITFTNHLISASNIQGSDPLLQGGSGRVWLSPSTHQLRLELQSDNGDAQAVVSGGHFWVYDPGANTVYEGAVPAHANPKRSSARHETLPSVSQIQTNLNKLAQHINFSGAIPSDVAGHAAYTVQVSPKHDGGLLGDAQALAGDVDAGLASIAEGIALAEGTRQLYWLAELYRLQGVLRLRRSAADRPAAEAALRQALAIARRQEAPSWELRAAIDLGRLLADDGRAAEAQALLAPLCHWFKEGLETRDLRAAHAFLAELRR